MGTPVEDTYRAAVSARGANAVAKIVGLPRLTILSICSGTAREGTLLVAEKRAPMLTAAPPAPARRAT